MLIYDRSFNDNPRFTQAVRNFIAIAAFLNVQGIRRSV